MNKKQKQDGQLLLRLPKQVKAAFEECCATELITPTAKIRYLIAQYLNSKVKELPNVNNQG
jgi:hypothetical protein